VFTVVLLRSKVGKGPPNKYPGQILVDLKGLQWAKSGGAGSLLESGKVK